MKVLVYGTGGIGSLTVHALCRAGNETAVAAKGKRREILREKGMQIRTHSGRKRWTDHPEVLDHEDESFFDAVFSIMQNQQQERILETLAGVPARYLVLVGNNLKSGEMEEKLLSLGWSKEQILFGFQESAGAPSGLHRSRNLRHPESHPRAPEQGAAGTQSPGCSSWMPRLQISGNRPPVSRCRRLTIRGR